MTDVVVAGLVLLGGSFMLLGGIGVVRMPDLFMRMQAATKAATLGVGCMLVAVAIHFDDLAVTTRALLVAVFVLITAPVGAHVIARAAYSVRVPLWSGTLHDDLEHDRKAGKVLSDESDPPTSPEEPSDTP